MSARPSTPDQRRAVDQAPGRRNHDRGLPRPDRGRDVGIPRQIRRTAPPDPTTGPAPYVRLARRLAGFSRPRQRLARLVDPRDLPVGGPVLGYLVSRDMRLMAADAEQMLGLAAAALGALVESVRSVAASSPSSGVPDGGRSPQQPRSGTMAR